MRNRPLPFVVAGMSAVALLTLTAPAQNAAKPDPNRESAKRPLALLESADWQDLFNGKDLTGWAGDTSGYVVKDGVLICQPGGKNLETAKDYGDFAFSFEF